MTELKVLPYSPERFATSFNRVLILPVEKPGRESEFGLVVGPDTNRLCEFGEVFATGENSCVKVRDSVLYRKIDRENEEHLDVVVYEGVSYDAIYEAELWAVNGQPLNRIFVKATSGAQVNEEGLLLPEDVRSTTQKGIIFRAPELYSMKEGDVIEYRKPEQGIYPTIDIDGGLYDVLNEADVFKVNGEVAPYRIIVRIDKAAQQIKQSHTAAGIMRSPLFSFMKLNLQYAEVLEIGSKAGIAYPGMRIGDTVIIHHSVEDKTQNYRLIKRETGQMGGVTYEHRIINCFDTSDREILGRISNRKKMTLVPYGSGIFLKWEFTMLEKRRIQTDIVSDFETDLDKCHDLASLLNSIDVQKKAYISKASAKVRGTHQLLAGTDPNVSRDEYDRRETAYKEAQAEALKVASYLQANHLVICQRVDNNERLVLPYKELYPLEILGKKYLIGQDYFVVGKISGSED